MVELGLVDCGGLRLLQRTCCSLGASGGRAPSGRYSWSRAPRWLAEETVSMTGRIGVTDHPIEHAAEDALGRARFATLLAEEIRSLDAHQGAVVGILGPWGYGKTSLLNLIKDALDGEPAIPVVDFNPWLFSGTEQLVATFFEEMSAQLRLKRDKLSSIADQLEQYGEALSPLRFIPMLGPWLDRLGTGGASVGRLLGRRSKARTSVAAHRAEIERHLATLEHPLVVIVDDLDRLGTSEIRDVFKLVRLTANFPNVIYILAFDRKRVEAALGEEGMEGRAYLEKILQVTYDVPAIPDEILRRIFLENLQDKLEGNPTGPFDEKVWPDIFAECIWPLVNNLRDAKRYLAVLPLTLRQLGEHVALVDVLAVEALRIFLPDTYSRLSVSAPALTSTGDHGYGRGDEEPNRQLVSAFVDSAGPRANVARAVCQRIFPASARYLSGSTYGPDCLRNWMRERRLAHPDVLSYFLDRVASEAMATTQRAEKAFALFGDEKGLREFFAGLSADEIEATVADLEAFDDEFQPATAIASSRVLLDQLPRLRTDARGMFDFGADMVVTRVVLRILRRVAEPELLLSAVKEIYASVLTLHGKYVLLGIVGYRENAGHKLIAAEEAAILEADLRSRIASAPAQVLQKERQLLRLLWWCSHPEEGDALEIDAIADDVVKRAALRASLTEVRSQAAGSRAVHREPRLAWEVLVDVVGGEEGVLAAVTAGGPPSDDPRLAEAVELATKYLGGWRPRDFSD